MNDPPRLFESDPNARDAIDAARGDVPDPKRLAKIAAGAAAAATVTAAATTSSAALAVKIIAGVVLVGAAVVVAVTVNSPSTPAPSPTPSPIITATATVTATVTAPATVAATAVSASAPRPLGPWAPGPLDEMATLDEAQRVLASNPQGALTLCDADAKANPKGTMAQEREVIAIDALMRLGRSGDAKARTARFHAAWPDSAHGRRVDALVELH